MRTAPSAMCSACLLLPLLIAGCAAQAGDADIYALLLARMPSGEAPPFSLVTADGERLDNSALAGKPYVIKAFAPSCAPCSEEARELRLLHERFGDGVSIVLVDIEAGDTAADLAGFREAAALPGWHLAVADGEMAFAYGLLLAGTTLVVDARGEIVYRDPGHQRPWAVLAAVEQALLSAPRQQPHPDQQMPVI